MTSRTTHVIDSRLMDRFPVDTVIEIWPAASHRPGRSPVGREGPLLYVQWAPNARGEHELVLPLGSQIKAGEAYVAYAEINGEHRSVRLNVPS